MDEVYPETGELSFSDLASKRQKTQRSYKRRLGTSVEFFCKFVKVHKTRNGTIVDTSGILSLPCYKAWLQSRKKIPGDPQKTFRKTIQAHCRGSDKRRPFPEEIETSLLQNLRQHDPWRFFDEWGDGNCNMGGKERRKESGFRKLGFHEGRRLKQKENRQFSEQLIRGTEREYRHGNVQGRNQENLGDGRYCDSIIAQVNRNLDGPHKFQIIDPGFRKVSIDMFMPHLEPENVIGTLDGMDPDYFDPINSGNISQLRGLWTNQSRSVLESFHDVSCEEIEQVMELRGRLTKDMERHFGGNVPDDVGGDIRLLRFLRKSNNNIDQAVRGFQSMLEWRDQNRVNEIREKLISENASIESLLKPMKSTRMRGLFPFFSLDKKGDIVDIWVFGDQYENPTGMTVQEFVHEHIQLAEFRSILLDRLSRTQNRVVKFLWLIDVSASTFRQRVWCPYFIHVAVIDQRYYPAQNSNILVIGGSRFVQLVWKCMCHVTDEDTKRDMFLFDANALKDSPLVEQAPDQLIEDCIPKFLGGYVTDELGVGTARQKLSTFL